MKTLFSEVSVDEAHSLQIVRKISGVFESGDRVLMSGLLGAGKSFLTRALLQRWGVEGFVPSPSFSLIQEYALKKESVFHVDLYRLLDIKTEEKWETLFEIGLLDILESKGGIVFVEWGRHFFETSAPKKNLAESKSFHDFFNKEISITFLDLDENSSSKEKNLHRQINLVAF